MNSGHNLGATARCTWIWALIVCSVGAPISFGGEVPESCQSRYWENIRDAFGAIGLSGTLEANYLLSQSTSLSSIGLDVLLEHAIELDPTGNPRSRWGLCGIYSCVVPTDRGSVCWKMLDGRTLVFDKRKIGRAYGCLSDPNWKVRELEDGVYQFKSIEGEVIQYEHGVLVGMDVPAIGPLHLRSIGGAVHSIERSNGDLWLQVEYDPAGNPIAVFFDSRIVHTFEWDAEGFLRKWQRPDGSVVSFSYDNGLLSEITDGNKSPKHVTWAENPGWRRGDSAWLAPVHVTSDGDWTYDYRFSSRGFVIEAKSREASVISRTIFNPADHRLEQTCGNDRYIVTFRPNAYTGTLESIRNGAGDVLEAFSYDAEGRIAMVRRRGERDIVLRYGLDGRLLDVDGPDVQ